MSSVNGWRLYCIQLFHLHIVLGCTSATLVLRVKRLLVLFCLPLVTILFYMLLYLAVKKLNILLALALTALLVCILVTTIVTMTTIDLGPCDTSASPCEQESKDCLHISFVNIELVTSLNMRVLHSMEFLMVVKKVFHELDKLHKRKMVFISSLRFKPLMSID